MMCDIRFWSLRARLPRRCPDSHFFVAALAGGGRTHPSRLANARLQGGLMISRRSALRQWPERQATRRLDTRRLPPGVFLFFVAQGRRETEARRAFARRACATKRWKTRRGSRVPLNRRPTVLLKPNCLNASGAWARARG